MRPAIEVAAIVRGEPLLADAESLILADRAEVRREFAQLVITRINDDKETWKQNGRTDIKGHVRAVMLIGEALDAIKGGEK